MPPGRFPNCRRRNSKVLGGSLHAGSNGTPRKLSQEQLLRLLRIGAAYSLSSKIVIRGGYGIFCDTINVLNRLPTFNYGGTPSVLARGLLQERSELS